MGVRNMIDPDIPIESQTHHIMDWNSSQSDEISSKRDWNRNQSDEISFNWGGI
jgi:hypothetical protein